MRVEAADLKCADAVADVVRRVVVRRVVVRRVVVRRGAEQCAEHPLCRLERLFTTAASRPSLLLVEQLQERADVLAGVRDELGVGVGLPAHLRRPVSPGEERTGRPDQPDVAAVTLSGASPVPAPAPAPDRSRLRAWHAQPSRRHPVRRSTSTPPRRCSLNPSKRRRPGGGREPGASCMPSRGRRVVGDEPGQRRCSRGPCRRGHPAVAASVSAARIATTLRRGHRVGRTGRLRATDQDGGRRRKRHRMMRPVPTAQSGNPSRTR